MARLVKIKSMSSCPILLLSSENGIRREFEKKGVIKPVDFEKLQVAIYEPGIEYLFKEGLLYIEDMQDKIDLGLEEPETEKPVNLVPLTEVEMARMMGAMPLADFKKKMNEITYEQALEVADYAIANKKSNIEKAKVIKEKTQIDVLSGIKIKTQEEEDAVNKEK